MDCASSISRNSINRDSPTIQRSFVPTLFPLLLIISPSLFPLRFPFTVYKLLNN